MESVYRQLIKVGGLFVILLVLALVWNTPPSRLDSKPSKIQRAVLQDDENDKGGDDDNGSLPECDFEEFEQAVDKCAFLANCTEESKIPYMRLHFCTLSDMKWLSYLFLIVMLCILFYVLGQISGRFFIPTLAAIANGLKMPSGIAGITLLAFGNGAPDIFSTFSGIEAGQYQQAFGQVVGTCSFISLAVCGVLSIGGYVTHVDMPRRPFLKDVTFLVVGICVMFFVVYDFKIDPWEPWFWVGTYVLYVLITIIGRAVFQKNKAENQLLGAERLRRRLINAGLFLPASHPIFSINLTEFGVITEDSEHKQLLDKTRFDYINSVVEAIESNDLKALKPLEPSEDEQELEFKQKVLKAILDKMDVTYLAHVGFWKTGRTHHPKQKHVQNHAPEDVSLLSGHEDEESHHEGTHKYIDISDMSGGESSADEGALASFETGPAAPEEEIVRGRDDLTVELPWYKRLLDIMEWDECSRWEKVGLVLLSPVLVIEHLTIHWAETEKYFRPFYVLQPVCIVPTIFYLYDLWGNTFGIRNVSLGLVIYWMVPISVLLSVAVFFTTKNNSAPIYDPIYVACGLVMSIIWIDCVADELVACLGVLGAGLGIPSVVLGLTVLAWGNSVGDLVANVLIAKKGFPEMATSAIYSAPITHLCLGLGLSFAVKTIQDGALYLTVGGPKAHLTDSLYLNFFFVIGGLLLTLVLVPVFKFRFSRVLGVILILIYSAGVIVCLLDVTKVILTDADLWSL